MTGQSGGQDILKGGFHLLQSGRIPLEKYSDMLMFHCLLSCSSHFNSSPNITFVLLVPKLGGGFKYVCLFSPLLGEDSHFDSYVSDGLKPPTSYINISKSSCIFVQDAHASSRPIQDPSQYVSYWSDEAILLPPKNRSANLQVYALKKLCRQLAELSSIPVIPSFVKHRQYACTSLAKLGYHPPVAGIPKRPKLPRAEETMNLVRSYLDKVKPLNTLCLSIDRPVIQPLIDHEDLEESSPKARYNAAATLRKKRLKAARNQFKKKHVAFINSWTSSNLVHIVFVTFLFTESELTCGFVQIFISYFF